MNAPGDVHYARTSDGIDIAYTVFGEGPDLPVLPGFESHLDHAWDLAMFQMLPPGNPSPLVSLTSPVAGSSFVIPAVVPFAADASDPNGSVAEVRFFADGVRVGSDTTAPYSFDWSALDAGSVVLTAEAEDDEGATRLSDPVGVTLLPAGSPNPIAVVNPGFEDPALADGDLEGDTALIPGWDFAGTANTFRGVFNPPAGSYPSAAGQGTPTGADGAQVAYLFDNGGPAESVSATQLLGENVVAGRTYQLSVSIGRFDPSQPYAPSTYGGYTIELLAGATVIASDTDTQDPPPLEFVDAVAIAPADSIPSGLVGEPLSVRLGISATAAARSTHFDAVRVAWLGPPAIPVLGPLACVALALGLLGFAAKRRNGRRGS